MEWKIEIVVDEEEGVGKEVVSGREEKRREAHILETRFWENFESRKEGVPLTRFSFVAFLFIGR